MSGFAASVGVLGDGIGRVEDVRSALEVPKFVIARREPFAGSVRIFVFEVLG